MKKRKNTTKNTVLRKRGEITHLFFINHLEIFFPLAFVNVVSQLLSLLFCALKQVISKIAVKYYLF